MNSCSMRHLGRPALWATLLASLALSACKTLPQQAQANPEPATAPAPTAAASPGPAGCKPVHAPSRQQAVATGAGLGAVLGGVIGSGMAKRSSVGARNGALFGALAGALAGSAYANDMGLAEQDDGSIKLNIPGKVLFASGSAEVSAAFKSTLERVAATMNEYCDVTARVVGHTDNVGQLAYNEALSLRRASTVAQTLRSLGVERSIQVQGMGPHSPLASNAHEEGRASNRRVELFIMPPPR